MIRRGPGRSGGGILAESADLLAIIATAAVTGRSAGQRRCVVRTAFVADPPSTFNPATDTTVGLMLAAQERGDQVWLTETGRWRR